MNFVQIIIATLSTVSIAVLLAEVYQAASIYISEGWLAAAVVNSVFAVALIGFLAKFRPQELDAFYFKVREGTRGIALFPSLMILAGSLVLVFISRNFGEVPETSIVGTQNFYWIFWIPVVEEIIFRFGFGRVFRNKLGMYWGAWYSSILFALMHSNPTAANLFSGELGISLGPLLLGFCCEFLLIKTGRLWPAVLFHAVCNATPLIFNLFDSRWLSWLKMLYI
jgi:membrane protease YdiL (CAAX protease family)